MKAVGVVFSPGGRVYSFDPAGLELAWNERVICQTAHGQELGRVVKANHALEEPPPTPLKQGHPPGDRGRPRAGRGEPRRGQAARCASSAS